MSLEQHVKDIVRQAVKDALKTKAFDHTNRRQLVIANWKMNMTLEKAVAFINQLETEQSPSDVVICPPYTLLYPLKALLNANKKSIGIGAQNLHTAHEGAHTGEISSEMLQDIGCEYVLVGHSERRAAGETDAMIHEKIKRALEKGLNPIICVGETIEQREQQLTNEVVNQQLLHALEGLQDVSSVIIAYEPVWAIGSGRSASPEDAQAVHEAIRKSIYTKYGSLANALPILYGGSVKPTNASALANMKDIDGFLVGGASLVADDFTQIVQACCKGMDR
ncbi:triose-phosphate isomerase [Virgibacillus sp. W0430]|uniref:triose-phosphate isomerase n=1 Tax=Virgibacillus sp. W0430 TaxID=3391580 RepID=UPI003F456733